MAIAVQQIRPVAHLPLVLGVLRRLEVASLLDDLLPPHPAHVRSTGCGVESRTCKVRGRTANQVNRLIGHF
jgi:hypothetical protein